jgi:hypothetical protein
MLAGLELRSNEEELLVVATEATSSSNIGC